MVPSISSRITLTGSSRVAESGSQITLALNCVNGNLCPDNPRRRINYGVISLVRWKNTQQRRIMEIDRIRWQVKRQIIQGAHLRAPEDIEIYVVGWVFSFLGCNELPPVVSISIDFQQISMRFRSRKFPAIAPSACPSTRWRSPSASWVWSSCWPSWLLFALY